jgi:tetratricopeptide (TPR) repeat protein
MRSRRRDLLAIFSSATLTLALGAAAAAEDGVLRLLPGATIKAAGNQIKGPVQAETPTEVKIANQTVPVEQIDSLEYEPALPKALLARNQETAGNLTKAAELYGEAAAEAGPGKPLAARAALFQRARVVAALALGDKSRMEEAGRLLETFIRSNPQSRQLGPALETLARLEVARGELDRADKDLADLAKVPWAEPRARVLQANLLVKRGQPDQAIARLDELLSKAPEGSERRREALLAKAEALGGLKKFDEGVKIAREVIHGAGPEDAEAQSAAHNTLGELLRQAGKPKDALIEFLQTDILYPRDREQHPRALAQIADLCRELKLEDQAKDAADRLRAEYPTSPYAAALGAGR